MHWVLPMPLLHQGLRQEELERQQPVNCCSRSYSTVIVHYYSDKTNNSLQIIEDAKPNQPSKLPTYNSTFQSGLWDFFTTNGDGDLSSSRGLIHLLNGLEKSTLLHQHLQLHRTYNDPLSCDILQLYCRPNQPPNVIYNFLTFLIGNSSDSK